MEKDFKQRDIRDYATPRNIIRIFYIVQTGSDFERLTIV